MIEYKTVPVRGVTHEEGDEEGVVTALVSVTGVKDNVNDIIEPGAYNTTLKSRMPKGVWNHTWTEPVSKTLAIEELAPGAKGLPTHLPDGSAWPEGAGALQVKMKFNLGTQRGKDAYSDVLFFGDEQEWSIGYKVPEGKSASRDGIRHIYEVDLFEYSPVLFGAMPSARTKTVREAQMSYKSMMGMDFKDDEGRVDKPPRDDADDDFDPTDEDFDADALDDEELKSMGLDFLLSGDDLEGKATNPTQDDVDDDGNYVGPAEDDPDLNPEAVRTLIQMLEDELSNDNQDTAATAAKGSDVYIEVKASGYASLGAAITDLIPEPSGKLVRYADHFDTAVKDADHDTATDIGGDVLDILETIQDEAKSDLAGLPVNIVSRVLMDRLEAIGDMEDPQQKSAVYVPESKSLFITMAGPDSTRTYGHLFDGKGERAYDSDVFLMTLPDAALNDLVGFAVKAEDYVLHATAVNQLRARQEIKRTFTQKQRDKASDSGAALPDGSYPIENQKDLQNALDSIGRAAAAGKLDIVKKHIAKQAKKLGLMKMLPDDWANYGKGDSDKDGDAGKDTDMDGKSMDMPTMADLLETDNFINSLR